MPPKNLKRSGQSKLTMVPKRSKRHRTTNPRYTTCHRTDDWFHEVERQKPRTAKTKSKKATKRPQTARWNGELGYFAPFIFCAIPSSAESGQGKPHTRTRHISLYVESPPPGMNPTSIDFCGPWQPINDTISSQAGFDFDTVNKAPGDIDVNVSGHPRL